MYRRRRSTRKSSLKTFDPNDARHVKHTQVGVWDIYEERERRFGHISGLAERLQAYHELATSFPYILRMVKDISTINGCLGLIVLYILVEIIASLVPAVSLWYSGQLLKIVQEAVDKRAVDKALLLRVAIGRFSCTVVSRLLSYIKNQVALPLNMKIKKFHSLHVFHAMARLDVPTFNNPIVQRQLEQAHTNFRYGQISFAWETVVMTVRLSTSVLQLVAQVTVLIGVLQGQRDGTLLAFLSFADPLFNWIKRSKGVLRSGVWAATTSNANFVKMQGLKKVVNDSPHRNEVVAGSLSEYLTAEYREALKNVPDESGEFYEAIGMYQSRNRLSLLSILREPLRELPQIVFTLRAVQYPLAIPLSLASLNLIQKTSAQFSSGLLELFDQAGSFVDQLATVKKLYEIGNIPNQVVDGRESFPENQQLLSNGISVEFRNVSFKYPGSESFALRNTSFKIGQGQLCVIVGANGSGKSTILKLIARLYDPTEGEIFIDGRDIRKLKLVDLRRALCVLFQDYTHFPLSVKDNIGLGDPENARDEERIAEAARLGGAQEFIDRLPDGFDTYLERPVRDYYSGLPEGTKTLFGRPVDYNHIRAIAGIGSTDHNILSGGQMQRLAVSRTFMRSLVSEKSVGLLLFDEPSASLDPTAEHDLFERLRQLRGNKTMIFSSHRFGNLTRHADIILYMNDASIVEEGTHNELLKRKGEYARAWTLQAQAFLP